MVNQKGYELALKLMARASTPSGFVAAVEEHDNYKRVWTRDGVITSIAALLSGKEALIGTAKATIETIFNHQHESGFMPSNVSPTDGSVSFGGTSGRADNPSWAVIGLSAYTVLTGDNSLWEKYVYQIGRCFSVMDAWEFNGKHLIYVPQSGDWADEYIQHGYVLFDQLLRLWALRLASTLSENKDWSEKALNISHAIQLNYWKCESQKQLYSPHLIHQLAAVSPHFWLMGFNPARVYHYFDLQANTFCLLLGVGNREQTSNTIAYVKTLYNNNQDLIPSFHPTIEYSDADMQELKHNYAYSFRNKPGYFHNGGLWPVWNGWLAASLNHHQEYEMALKITADIHRANSSGDLFNECLNGTNQSPCGIPNCTWSAAGAVIAEQAIKNDAFTKLFSFKFSGL
ncbi:glycoside hydrolase 100 family protein [Pedobacter sp. BG31]|uniref:glycoside hydrolase 100 family protein n=1 Tax=Pedobacter sp. BG31 TaxID=3349697 RepID=UPI0035F366E3